MSLCYAVTSGKGGTGKSTVAVGLGIAFAQKGKKTLLVDMDEGLRCLDLMLGIEKELVFDLSDIFNGSELESAIYSVPDTENLYIIPASDKPSHTEPSIFSKLAKNLLNEFDIVIFDFPAGIDFTLYGALPEQTAVLAVCNPDPVSVRDAASVCDLLPIPSNHTKLIVNKFVYKTLYKGLYSNIDDIIDRSGFQLIGVIPHDSELSYFSVKHKLKRNGKAFAAFKRITDRLCGEHVLLPNPKKI